MDIVRDVIFLCWQFICSLEFLDTGFSFGAILVGLTMIELSIIVFAHFVRRK